MEESRPHNVVVCAVVLLPLVGVDWDPGGAGVGGVVSVLHRPTDVIR